IGQIYDVFELEAAQLEEATQNVLEDKSAVIADVGVVIDGRAATVHAHLAGFLRNEGFDFSRQSIVELEKSNPSFRRNPARCACTVAARPSMTTPTSAITALLSSRTFCVASSSCAASSSNTS